MRTTTLPDLLSYGDLPTHGITRNDLNRLIDSGEFERIAPGLFLRAGLSDDTTAAWIAIATKRSEATICLLTAASIHDLTDEIPAGTSIAIPRGKQPVTVYNSPVIWHRFDVNTFSIGRTWHSLPDGSSIGLYSAERTLIDLFRLRHILGTDLALDALKRWLRQDGNSPSSLLATARAFPKAYPAIHHSLEVLL